MKLDLQFDEKILCDNLGRNGGSAIDDKTVEELAELIQALQKHRESVRKNWAVPEIVNKHHEHLIEEMADVYIVLENTKLLHGIRNDMIQERINIKQERQAKRLAGDLPYVD